MTTSKSVQMHFIGLESQEMTRFFSHQMRARSKNILQASLKIGNFEDVWRFRGQRGHQILEAKVHNLKNKG